MDDFEAFALRKAAHSVPTFGLLQTDEGLVAHLGKEGAEVLAASSAKDRQREWVDVVHIGLWGLLRGLIREGYSTARAASEAVHMIRLKQTTLESREWPDWRTVSPDKAIEHVREKPSYDELNARISQVSETAPVGSVWQHVKSGGIYRVAGICIIEASSEPAIIYHHSAGSPLAVRFLRHAAEFLDGRFARRKDWDSGDAPPREPLTETARARWAATCDGLPERNDNGRQDQD